MNRFLIPMGIAILPAMLAGCSDKDSEQEKVIEKPEVKIENGMLTPEVLEAFGRISEVTPSPDGSLLAFTLTYEDIEENKGNAEIYTMKPDGSDMKRLTHTESSEGNLAWIDNGERLAYVGKDKKTDKPQVFTMKPDGSDSRRVTEMENGVECFRFSPDGKKIIVASAIKPYNENDELLKDLKEDLQG